MFITKYKEGNIVQVGWNYAIKEHLKSLPLTHYSILCIPLFFSKMKHDIWTNKKRKHSLRLWLKVIKFKNKRIEIKIEKVWYPK